MSEAPILVEQHPGYRIITLNRPDKLNAFNEAMHVALRAAIDEAEADESTRALMITGAGRAFCAGQDLADRLAKPGETAVPRNTLDVHYNPLVRKLRALPFPVIAAVNGVAAGAGCNIALACDIVIAATSASFIQSFARIGLIPDSGGTWILPRLVGEARARGLALLAQELKAEKAAEWGLIWRCVADDALIYEARRICEHFSVAPTQGLALIKRALDASSGNSLDAQLDLERDLQREASLQSRLCRGRARLHGKAQTEFHRPQETVKELRQGQLCGRPVDVAADHDVERQHDAVVVLIGAAVLDRMRKIARPNQQAAFFRHDHDGGHVVRIHFGMRGLDHHRARARIAEHGRAAIFRRAHVKNAAQQAIGMDMQMMAVIGVGDVGPHIGDVMRVAFDLVVIQNLPGLSEDEIRQLLHLRQFLNVVRRDEDPLFHRALFRRLHGAQLGLGPVAGGDIGYFPGKNRGRENRHCLPLQ